MGLEESSAREMGCEEAQAREMGAVGYYEGWLVSWYKGITNLKPMLANETRVEDSRNAEHNNRLWKEIGQKHSPEKWGMKKP